jgi:hypoxanthine-DNA glycosylase
MINKRIFSFPPIAATDSRVLILGTIPGKASLSKEEYYAHPRNAFWPLMFNIFEQGFSNNYHDKRRLILERGIALWDVLKGCERDSSLDSDIGMEEPNDFEAFFKLYPKIETICFNGQPAFKFFNKYIADCKLDKVILPSTSPAHAISIEKKMERWAIIKTL